MTRRRRLGLATVALAIVVLLVGGNAYARSLASLDQADPASTAGCGDAAMGDMHSTMWAGLAESLGLTTDQLDKALADGKTLENLARDKGISEQKLADEMLEAMKAALDQQVGQGKLTRQDADSWIEAAKQHMTPDHIASMGSGAGSMHGGAGSGMDSMHDTMHGNSGGDTNSGGSCHGDGAGSGTTYPGSSMMGQMF